MSDFVHLHNHSHYSLLDAACTTQELVDAAVSDGHKSLALTDHGVMFGCYEFYKLAKNAGIKPILGFEAYISNGSRFDTSAGKAKTKKKNYFHLILLAKNMTGYKNLMKLTTYGHTEGFYYKPRIDKELLEKHHEGVIAMSACIAGVVNAHLINNDYPLAYETAQYYKNLFGDDFYMELQKHDLIDDQIVLEQAPKIAKELGIKLVATNDVHYIKKEHAIAHNVLLFIRDVTASNSGQVDVTKLRYRTPEMYFKTKKEMFKLFADFPDALANTLEIADKCNVEFKKNIFMPDFPIPSDSKSESLDDYLEELTFKGLKERYKENLTDDIISRTKFELDVIKKMKFPGYFLIVADFIQAAKNLGVRVGPGRGSAAGSVVAYSLGITNVDPLPYDLLFERFLNPERVSMPDIDIDFSDDKREKVIDYVKQKYGEDSVVQIITFGKLSSRAVLTDVGRVLGVELSIIKSITSKIPSIQGKVLELKDAVKLPELEWVNNSTDQKIKDLINYSLILEGKCRNVSTHAAGVVIAPGAVIDYVPLYLSSKSTDKKTEMITQYGMKDLEDAGLLKMDFLGLRTLSIIDKTLAMIKENHNVDMNIDDIDFEDEATYDLMSNGSTLGVFQFESGGMQEYLRQLKPRNLEEITAMNALYRPGPMKNIPDFIDRKHGKKPIKYVHPLMESSLKKTYGVIVYQEQVMQLARDIAGFTLGQADILRKAMGKKDKPTMDKLKPQFIEGAEKNSVTKKKAEEIYELIYKFAEYGFNKSHSLAYSYLAYQTAWLKTHYPAEFLAANMSAELINLDKIVLLIEDAKKLSIKVLPPDINRSMTTFAVIDNNILFGLAGIKNVGISAVDSIIEVRKEKSFTSFFDFVARVDSKLINKRALEALVYAGAFDSLTQNNRNMLFSSIESALEYGKAFQDSKNNDMDSLFGGESSGDLIEPVMKPVEDWSEMERLDKEKEVMNLFISGNPLDKYKFLIEDLSTNSLGCKESITDGNQVRVCGIISSIRKRLDRKQKQIAFVILEDYTGRAECIFWSDSYNKYQNYLNEDSIIMCSGKSKLESAEQDFKIVVDEVMTIEEALRKFAKGFYLKIIADKNTDSDLKFLQSLCNQNHSRNTIIFNVYDKDNNYVSRYDAHGLNIPMETLVLNQIIERFGKENFKLIIH